MADRRDPKSGKPSGVRGPGGPPRPPAAGQPQRGVLPPPPPGRPATGARATFERISFPAIQWMTRLPRWLVVVTPAVLLFLGLLQTGNLAWLGGVLLLAVALLLGWLTALSWPRISLGQRFARVLVVAALVGVAILKFRGRF